MNPSNRFDLTDEMIETLKAEKAARGGVMSLSAASAVAGVHRETLRKAAGRRGMRPWLAQEFPNLPEHGGGGQHKEKGPDGLRNLYPDQIKAPLDIDMSSVYVRSAAMNWRGVA